MIIVIVALVGCTEQPQRNVSAKVISISEHANPRWKPEEVVITARSDDGAVGSRAVLRNRQSCKLGDPVKAVRRGVALTLDGDACER